MNKHSQMLATFCDSDSWKPNHDEVKQLWNLEDAIELGMAVFAYFQGCEARAYQHAKGSELTEVDQLFGYLYGKWHKKAEAVLAEARVFVAKNYEVGGLFELQSAIALAAPHAESPPVAGCCVSNLSADDLDKLATTNPPPEWWYEGESC